MSCFHFHSPYVGLLPFVCEQKCHVPRVSAHTATQTRGHTDRHQHTPLISTRMWKQRDTRGLHGHSPAPLPGWSWSPLAALSVLSSSFFVTSLSICLSLWGWFFVSHFRKLIFISFFKNFLWDVPLLQHGKTSGYCFPPGFNPVTLF